MKLLTPGQARELDRVSMGDMGISIERLMGNAGKQVAEEAMEMVSDIHDSSILILSGKGNNGGDGFAAATVLFENNYNVRIHSLCKNNEIKGDSLNFYLKCESLGIFTTFGESLPDFKIPDLIIDGLLGTGFKGALRESMIPWVEWINNSKSLVLSIDISSGLDGNSGRVNPIAVKANTTVAFGAPKLGSIFRFGQEYSGIVHTKEIGFPNLEDIELPGLNWDLFQEFNASLHLQKPKVDCHKYSAGKVLVIAGSKGMTGAAILSTYGALRSGAGLTTTTTPASLNEIYERLIIEGITLPLEDHGKGYLSLDNYDSIEEKLEWADSVVLGPGLGRDISTQNLIKKLVRIIEKPLVLDADGLFPFSNKMGDLNDREYPLIITPHIGELSYLTGIDKEKIISEFPIVMNEVMTDFRHIALVKQVPSCTFYKNSAMVNSSGNPGLATGGTGDVLSGMIASFIAQGIDHYNSVSLAAFIHGKASDELIKEKGFRGQIASDILEKIPYIISGYEKS